MSSYWENTYIDSHALSLARNQSYEYELSIQPKACNQHKTGKCWLFAGLNCMRLNLMKYYDLDIDFELSVNYLYFWDKYERCKYFLTLFPNLDKQSNVYNQLLYRPITDGGQWHMFVNLVNKYGIVPKNMYDETQSSRSSANLNKLLNNLIKKSILKSDPVSETLCEVYDILLKNLGEPPNHVRWNNQHYSPQIFYTQFVKPYHNVDNYVNLINDPRNSYNQFYTIDYMTNMVNSNGPLYYNVPMKTLMNYAKTSIILDQPIWFACDMSKYSSQFFCVNGPSFFKDTYYDDCLSKEERLTMLDTSVSHAMVLHGFSKSKWKIENSWGNFGLDEGYYIADNKWMKEYVYQMIIPKSITKHFPKTNYKPKNLPLFDPFGMFPLQLIK